MDRFRLLLTTLLLLTALIATRPSLAQQTNSRLDTSTATVLIPGAMRGLGTTGPIGYMRLCAPLSVGLYEWRLRWIERFVKPTAEQTPPLNELIAASAKARETIAAACQKEPVVTSTVQLSIMEKRVVAMMEALKVVRPAYEKFYASLDARQQDFLNALGPGRRGWRW
jgi:hypothetical protein